MYINTVIMVWMQETECELEDLLRGTVYLCELSHHLNFRLIIDMQLHPVSDFLISTEHEYSEYVRNNKHRVLNFVNADKKIIIKSVMAQTVDPILLISNIGDNNMNFSEYAKSFIQKLLTPTHEFRVQFNTFCTKYEIASPYSILYFRLGDSELVEQYANHKTNDQLLLLVDATVVHDTRIISDSHAFNTYLSKVRPHLANRIHLLHSTNKDWWWISTIIKETLFDFFFIMHARSVKTYSNNTLVCTSNCHSPTCRWCSALPIFSIEKNHVSSPPPPPPPSSNVRKKSVPVPNISVVLRHDRGINLSFTKNYYSFPTIEKRNRLVVRGIPSLNSVPNKTLQ
jgi:hypothetical protein